MPKPLNLVGMHFGDLEVVNKSKSQNGKVYWLCRCKCNAVKEIQASNLTSGRITSCGHCGRKARNNYVSITKKCDICGKTFSTKKYGHNRRFCYDCSPFNTRGSESITSIRRAIKQQLVKYKGGKCELCGYDKCIAALQFHHTNSNEKEFSISSEVNLGNFNMKDYYNEVDKCMLLCANCHAEIHTE